MKNSLFLTVLLGLLFVSAAVAQEPGDTLWTKIYGGVEEDIGSAVQQTRDGGYIIAGWTKSFGPGEEDIYLLKTDANGDTAWTKTYGGTWEDDGANSVQQTSDGGYIIAGYTRCFGAGVSDVWLLKTDANGDTLWTRTFGGYSWDGGSSVQQTQDEGYIIAGWTESYGAGAGDVYLIKTHANGDTAWTRTFGGGEWEQGYSVQQTGDEGYIISGTTESYGAGDGDIYLMKTDADGGTLWTRTYGGTAYEEGFCVQQTSDGGYIIVGFTESYGPDDVYLVKTDANGDPLWTRTHGGSEFDLAQFVRQTSDGGYIIVGLTESYGGGEEDLYLIKTDADGDTVWTRAYGGDIGDYGFCVQQTLDGGYIVSGGTESYAMGQDADLWLLRIAGQELPAVSIGIIPDDPPVRVPPGGRFGFTGTLTNNTEEPQITDAWTMAIGPEEETYGPFKEFGDLELQPHQTRTAHFNQHVPSVAPLGFYNYIAYCGDYPSTVVDSCFFQVEVTPDVSSGGENVSWLLTGSFDKSGDFSSVPSDFALLGNYPNPFNAKTLISYQLGVSGHVKLEVYNLGGQKLATLVNREQQAGYNSVSWDGSEVSSGLYLYKLTAGDFSENRRMMLVK